MYLDKEQKMALSPGSGYRQPILFSYNKEEDRRIRKAWVERLRMLGLTEYKRLNSQLATRLIDLIKSVRTWPQVVDRPSFHETTFEEIDQLDLAALVSIVEPLTINTGNDYVGRISNMYPATVYGVRIYQSIWLAIYPQLSNEEKELILLIQIKGDLQEAIARRQEIDDWLEEMGAGRGIFRSE